MLTSISQTTLKLHKLYNILFVAFARQLLPLNRNSTQRLKMVELKEQNIHDWTCMGSLESAAYPSNHDRSINKQSFMYQQHNSNKISINLV